MNEKIDLTFLQESYSSRTKKEPVNDFEYLCTWYFGTSERSIKVCARRAYGDLRRNLQGISKMSDDDKKSWRSYIENEIIPNQIDKLFGLTERITAEKFKEWHYKACKEIIENSNCCNEYIKTAFSEGFTYGLAQKWLNMTLKYIGIMGKWNDEFERIKDSLHVPVDSYIIDAAWNKSEKIVLPLKEPKKERSNQYSKPSEYVEPWSKWNNYKVYYAFQESLAESLIGDNKSPYEWEREAWLKQKELSDSKSK